MGIRADAVLFLEKKAAKGNAARAQSAAAA